MRGEEEEAAAWWEERAMEGWREDGGCLIEETGLEPVWAGMTTIGEEKEEEGGGVAGEGWC